ncbi:MAG: hypothetical protein AAGD10_12585 [Myxococcota bacterium]
MAKRKGNGLEAGLQAVTQGDYIQARAEFGRVGVDEALSESRRAEATRWIAATRLDRGTLLVGLACIGLFLLVVGVAVLKQPH